MRITVYDVLSYLAAGDSTEDILENFPMLTKNDVLACLAFATDAEKRLQNLQVYKLADLIFVYEN